MNDFDNDGQFSFLPIFYDNFSTHLYIFGDGAFALRNEVLVSASFVLGSMEIDADFRYGNN